MWEAEEAALPGKVLLQDQDPLGVEKEPGGDRGEVRTLSPLHGVYFTCPSILMVRGQRVSSNHGDNSKYKARLWGED